MKKHEIPKWAIRDNAAIILSAAPCDRWFTVAEMRSITGAGRHLHDKTMIAPMKWGLAIMRQEGTKNLEYFLTEDGMAYALDYRAEPFPQDELDRRDALLEKQRAKVMEKPDPMTEAEELDDKGIQWLNR